jgi:hypothetical protein
MEATNPVSIRSVYFLGVDSEGYEEEQHCHLPVRKSTRRFARMRRQVMLLHGGTMKSVSSINLPSLKAFIRKISDGANARASITLLNMPHSRFSSQMRDNRILINCDGFEVASQIWRYCYATSELRKRLVIEFMNEGLLRPYTAH